LRRDLFNYLEKLTNEDLVQVEKYLESPFFNVTNRKRVIQLFNFLKKHHPHYHNNSKTEKTFLAKKLKFHNIANLKSNLLDAITDFIVQKGLQRNKTIQSFLIADTLDYIF